MVLVQISRITKHGCFRFHKAVMVKGKHGDNVLQFVGISLLMNEELFCGPNSKVSMHGPLSRDDIHSY